MAPHLARTTVPYSVGPTATKMEFRSVVRKGSETLTASRSEIVKAQHSHSVHCSVDLWGASLVDWLVTEMAFLLVTNSVTKWDCSTVMPMVPRMDCWMDSRKETLRVITTGLSRVMKTGFLLGPRMGKQ